MIVYILHKYIEQLDAFDKINMFKVGVISKSSAIQTFDRNIPVFNSRIVMSGK